MAATWLRKISKIGRLLRAPYFGAERMDADPMDEEEFLDAWARYQDSPILSRLYSVKQHGFGTANARRVGARDDAQISTLRAACTRTSSTGRRTWVIGDTMELHKGGQSGWLT